MSRESIAAHHEPAKAIDRFGLTARRDVESSRDTSTVAETPGVLWVGAWSGEDFVVLKGQLVGLNQDGLFAIVDGLVRAGQRIWLRLDGSSHPETNVPALVLGATWLRRGRCALRLELPENGPAGFYEDLVREFARAQSHAHASRHSRPR